MRSAFATLSHNSASVNWGCPMRLAVLTLVLSTTAAGLSQSPAPASQSPQQDNISPPSIALSNPALTLSNLPPNLTITSVQRLPKIVLPPGQLSLRDGAATLESKDRRPSPAIEPRRAAFGHAGSAESLPRPRVASYSGFKAQRRAHPNHLAECEDRADPHRLAKG